MNDRSRPAEGGSETMTPAKVVDRSLPIDSAYCVLAMTPYDRQRRRLFLSLHSAVQAVQRARKRGLQAELVLCKLILIQADLDLYSEWSE
jgi:hypothetical protein